MCCGMYDDIIVATDGEAGAAAALAAAVDLAVIHEATLHGVFVLDPRIYTAYSGDEYVDDAEGPVHGLLELGGEARGGGVVREGGARPGGGGPGRGRGRGGRGGGTGHPPPARRTRVRRSA